MNEAFAFGFLDELEKVGLDLRTARKMTQSLKDTGKLVRRPLASVFSKDRRAKINRGPMSVPVLSNKSMSRFMESKGQTPNPTSVAAATKRLKGFTHGKGRIFSKGHPMGTGGGLMRQPSDPKKPEHREMIGHISLGHERSELRHGKRGEPTFRGHASPGVLVEESSMLASLPKEHKAVKDYFVRMRRAGGEAQTMEKMVRGPAGKPGFQYGNRYSRHARKRIAEIVKRKSAEDGG